MSNDIFNLQVNKEDLLDAGKSSSESIIYKLNAKDGKNNTAVALLKFIPDINNPSKLWTNKWTIWLANPSTDEKRMMDCPSSIKQPSILQDCFFALNKSDNATEKQMARFFKRKEVYFSLCDVLQDPQKPENEGNIKIFRYGIKVFEKIKNLMFPENEDMVEKNVPFDLFNGKPLMLKVKIESDFNNFDDSIFLDKIQPITLVQRNSNGEIIRNADGKVAREKVTANASNYAKIEQYLKEYTPAPLSDFDFKPWTQEDWDFATDAIAAIIPNERMIEKIFKKFGVTGHTFSASTTPKAKAKSKAINDIPMSKKIDLDDDDDNDVPFENDDLDNIINVASKTSKKSAKAETQKPTQKKNPAPIVEDIDDIDDIDLGNFDDDDDDDYGDL